MADTAADDRWPEFGRVAAEHGITTTLSVPIIVGGRGIGALNFYDNRPGRFDDRTTAAATVFARHSAIVAAHYDRAEEADNLQRAMASRAEIEQAKGVIMATAGCNADEAFELLRQQSQSENRKLRDVARELVQRQPR